MHTASKETDSGLHSDSRPQKNVVSDVAFDDGDRSDDGDEKDGCDMLGLM
jgi:hypothetical protein